MLKKLKTFAVVSVRDYLKKRLAWNLKTQRSCILDFRRNGSL